MPETLKAENRETLMVLAAVPGRGEPQPREAKVVAVDNDHDVALLRITGAPLPAMTVGDSGRGARGPDVAFTGFPIGHVLGFFPVTHRAMISSINPIALPRPTRSNSTSG